MLGPAIPDRTVGMGAEGSGGKESIGAEVLKLELW